MNASNWTLNTAALTHSAVTKVAVEAVWAFSMPGGSESDLTSLRDCLKSAMSEDNARMPRSMTWKGR